MTVNIVSIWRLVPVLALPALALTQAMPLPAQDIPYGLGTWNPDSLGNHRARVRVTGSGDAVRVHLPWRRRDAEPETKRIVVTAASGLRARNVAVGELTREAGDLAFEPNAGPGEYFVYYMPYEGSVRSNYPKITYQKPDSGADPAWIERHALARGGNGWQAVPTADVVAFEAVDSMSRVDPMELIATASEARALLAKHPGRAFLAFPEDRSRSIRMMDDVPQHWIARGPDGPVSGEAERGEFYTFQVGVWAQQALDSLDLAFSALRGPRGARIPASALSSISTRGIDWQGRPFRRRLQVAPGKVQALWAGVMVPERAAAGEYTGTVTVLAAGAPPLALPVRLTVLPKRIVNHGDDEPWRLTRLRWLDSRMRLDTSIVPPYTPVKVRGTRLDVLGRSVQLAPSGLPAQVTSFFSDEMTSVGTTGRPMLAAPVRFVVEDDAGTAHPFEGRGVKVVRALPGAAHFTADASAGGLDLRVNGQLEFDGNIEYTVALVARRATTVRDIRLEIPLRADVARWFTGMHRKGGAAPASYDWLWDVKRNQDAAWIGDVNAGLQFTLKDEHYVRPLNTNFYQLRPLVMPASWQNGGQGGCRFRLEGEVYRATCFSGARTMAAGDTLRFDLRLLLTPFHTLDTKTHFATRYFHRYTPVDSIRAKGANIVNVHHATPVNPYINYPFLVPDAMRAYADSIHAAGMRMKIYYTVRELTNRTPELWALRSLGAEVLASGPGGGHSWLQEHFQRDYITGWVVPELRDVAVVTSGISRWHNFYVEGLQWLKDHVGIDGIYLDDVAFDRTTMQRIRRVLAPGAPGERIDLHSANQYNPSDGFASSTNLYLEHFPYVDRLWFGEYFDYGSAPDYWMVEMSGLPFGLMGEMLQDGGNPWRGMVFGMTNRLPWAGDPRPVWKAWDAFGITESRMVGWWAKAAPVRTGRDDVLATTYLRPGRAMVAVASWAADTARVPLAIDWRALGLDSSRAVIRAEAIDSFQPAATFAPGEAIPIMPARGWLLTIEPR
jgi:hypothetical protein